MARSQYPPHPPQWSPEKALPILKQQLGELLTLKGRSWNEIKNEEREWRQVTDSVICRAFGEDSRKHREFIASANAGVLRIGGVSDGQLQQNFNTRVDRFEATLKSAIRELEMQLPQPEIRGAYDAGEEFAFYKDLKSIVTAAKSEVFVADNYLNSDIFELYVEPIPASVTVRILTDDVRGNLAAVAGKYASRGNFELRASKEFHDRAIFIDDRCWLVGQSIKDAAKKKPTYLIEFHDAATMKNYYEEIWSRAATVLKG